jgi:hypothetical protein
MPAQCRAWSYFAPDAHCTCLPLVADDRTAIPRPGPSLEPVVVFVIVAAITLMAATSLALSG